MLIKEQLLTSGQYNVQKTSNKLFVWGLGTTGQVGTVLYLFSLAQLSAGSSHAVALTSDNRLLAWGLNSSGQLGDGTVANKSFPQQVGGKGGWKKVSAGNDFTVAVRGDGTLLTWGLNASGQLGIGTTTNRSSPTQAGAGVIWNNIDAGGDHVLATNNNALLYAWGLNNAGQLGVTDTINRSSPVQVIGLNSWLQLSAGLSFSAAINTDYKLYAWGLNASGQLGLTDINPPNGDTINRSSPVQVGTLSWQLVSAGQGHTAAIRDNSTLWTWGLNTSFQLGNNSSINRSSPIQISTGSGSGSWKNVSAGNAFTLAIANDPAGLTNNLLFSWGRNQEGQTGFNGTTTLRSTPQQITTGSWALISAGSSFSVATNNNKLLYTWGAGAGGTQADGVLINRSSPVLVSFSQTISQSSPIQIGVNSWVSISAGNNFFVALRSDNLLYAWGNNADGNLGDNTIITKSSPVQIGTSSWTAISAKGGSLTLNTVLAIRSDNTLWGWGVNTLGLTAVTTSWKQVSAATAHVLALRSDGSLWAWGGGGNGQIGNNSAVTRSSPVQIGALSNWSMVSAGQNQFSSALNTLGEFYVWGNNGSGDLGLNDTINRSSPVAISTNTGSWVFVAGNKGITNDGKLWSWGFNNSANVGDGTTISQSTPVQIISGNSFVFVTNQVTARVGAIDTLGKLWVWGNNTSGSLGLNDIINRSTPVQLTNPDVSWVMISTANDQTAPHTLGITTTGALYVWGANQFGQLGLSNTINRSVPFQLGNSSWAAVSNGDSSSVGIDVNGTLYAWGLNTNGRLADGTSINKSSPVVITGGGAWRYSTNSWKTLSASTSNQGFVIIVRDDGSIYAWGGGTNGVLGNNSVTTVNLPSQVTPTVPRFSSPVQIGSSSNWSKVSLGHSTAAAINSLGELYTWGQDNRFGTLGDDSTLNRLIPAKITTSSWSQISVGYYHALGLRTNNTMYTWGLGTSGQLGDDTLISKSSPIQIGTSYAGVIISSWVYVSAGNTYSLAIDANNKLYGWGNNNVGQLGIVTETFSWTQLDGGSNYAGAIRQDGTLWMWGINTTGNLGTGDILSRSSPTQIGTSSWTQVAATKSIQGVTAAIRSDGLLFTWGTNQYFALGDNSTVNKSSPVQIGNSSWSQVSVGWYHTLAIDAAGRLFGWGFFSALNASTAPFSWTMVSENTSHVVAVRSDGLLFTWGLNSSGQLGDNTTITKSSPTQIGTSSWTTASAGIDHTLAITSNNRLFAWGGNAANQLGDNSTINKSSPVQVTNPSISWSTVSAANSFSMGITSTKSLYVWGLGTSGQLGTLTEILSWSAVSAGSSNSLAIRNNGRLYGWGLNNSGQLGDGSTITKSSPVQVSGTSSWSTLTAGTAHCFAIDNNYNLYGWGLNNAGQLGLANVNTTGDTINRSNPTQLGITFSVLDISSYQGIIAKYGTSYTSSTVPSLTGTPVSGSFNGTSDYLRVPNNSIFMITTTDFTAEVWIYVTGGAGTAREIIGVHNSGTSINWELQITAANVLSFFYQGTSGGENIISDSTVPSNQWVHVAGGISGSNKFVCLNGVYKSAAQITAPTTTGNSLTLDLTIGATLNPTFFFTGYISNARVVKGVAVYTGNYTVPTSVLTSTQSAGTNINAITGTQTSLLTYTTESATIVSNSFASVNAGSSFTGTITTTGKLFLWGLNTSGQLGIGDVSNRSVPTQIDNNSWSILSAGAGHTMAILTNGILYAWGLNNAGQLGLTNVNAGGDTINRSSPVQIGTSSWSVVSAGASHTLAIRSDNTIWSWGVNTSGQLGLTNINLPHGDTINRSSPVQVTTGSWNQVSAGFDHSMAIKLDGTLWGWGNNSVGQVGANTVINTSSPVQIGLSSWSQVSAGNQYTLARDINGILYAWGQDTTGQLGF